MKNILFTGASGFLGQNIVPVLKDLGYSITSIGLMDSYDYKFDLSKTRPDLHSKYHLVLHAAGKAHSISRTISEDKLFFDVNLKGTQNLCAALEKSGPPSSFIFISTVAVYGCETGLNITEDHTLDGLSPYALSKIQAEVFLKDWCNKHGVILTILRPSLIAGKNPIGNLGSMIRGLQSGRYVRIGNGEARKSLIMAEDIARLVPVVGKKGGVYNVCDNCHPSFRELEDIVCTQLGRKQPLSIPYWLAKSFAFLGDMVGSAAPINSQKLDKITKSLTFSNQKAVTQLQWQPMNVLEHFKIV
jgi:GlcNAc-P-P-Und epimerase